MNVDARCWKKRTMSFLPRCDIFWSEEIFSSQFSTSNCIKNIRLAFVGFFFKGVFYNLLIIISMQKFSFFQKFLIHGLSILEIKSIYFVVFLPTIKAAWCNSYIIYTHIESKLKNINCLLYCPRQIALY